MQIFEDFFQKKGEKPQVNSQKKNTTGGKQQRMPDSIRRNYQEREPASNAGQMDGEERKEDERKEKRAVWHGICCITTGRPAD